MLFSLCSCDIVMPHMVGVLVTASFYSRERQKLKLPLLLGLSQRGLARDPCWSCHPSPNFILPLQHALLYVTVVSLIAFHPPPYRLAQPRGSVVVSGERPKV